MIFNIEPIPPRNCCEVNSECCTQFAKGAYERDAVTGCKSVRINREWTTIGFVVSKNLRHAPRIARRL